MPRPGANLTPEERVEAKKRCLQGIAERGTIGAGIRAAGVDRMTYYHWRDTDQEFAQDVENAFRNFADDLEEVALDRAKNKSDLLTIFTLKAHKKDKYGDRPPPDPTATPVHITIGGLPTNTDKPTDAKQPAKDAKEQTAKAETDDE